MIDTLRIDIRHAARALGRSPFFTAIAVLSLAFGIGATTAAFSLVDALLFRALPFAEADRLVDVYEHHPVEVCEDCGVGTSYPNYEHLRTARSFNGMAAYQSGQFTLNTGEGAERWAGAYASASLFPLLGVEPLHGRVFHADEDAVGAERVVVIGERLWRTRLGARPDAVGSSLRVNGELHTIIGVMPAELTLPPFTDLWLPLAPVAADDGRAERNVGTVARFADGVTLAAARAEVTGLGRQLAQAYPESNTGWSAHVMPLRTELAADYANMSFIMLGIVGFVLLVACANLANLLLARASARRQELAVRAALGASRRALVRHLLAESLLVSLTAGALGLLIASWALDVFAAIIPDAMPSWVRFGIDARVALFAALLSILTGVAFGIIPALQAARVDPNTMLREGARGSIGGQSRTRVRNAFVTIQIAAAMVLVFGATFLTSEFLRIADFDLGEDPDRVYVGRVIAGGERFAEPRILQMLTADLAARIRVHTGASDVALSNLYVPSWPGMPSARVEVEGRADADLSDAIHRIQNVSASYFSVQRTQIIAGRDFRDSDGEGAPRVAIISSNLAQLLWPGESAVGRNIRISGVSDDWISIVGVVETGRLSPFAREAARLMYLPLAQHAATQPPSDLLSLQLRFNAATSGVAQRVKAAAAAVDPDIIVEDVRSRRVDHEYWIAPVRNTARAVSGLGLFGVLLAAMGIYGVVAFTVSQRVPELGIRIALGATRAGIMRLVLDQALRLAAIGAVFGTIGAFVLGRVLRSQMTGSQAGGPLAFVLPILTFVAVALLASWVPARRAARIDPLAALRAD
jgi:putative ABC transport system permease protein